MHKRKLKRILAMMVATTTILGMSITTFAAPADFNAVEYAIVNPDVRAVYGTDADALYNHYQSFGQSENRIMTIADAVSKGKSVDVKQMIAQFITENKSLYVDNVLNGEFAYFNLETYKAENPDVVEVVGDSPLAVLNHYLTFGAYEGRSCGTKTDPVVAIVSHPESFSTAQQAGGIKPEAIMTNYSQATGTTSTEGIHVAVSDSGQPAVTKVDAGAPAASAIKPSSTESFNGVVPSQSGTGSSSGSKHNSGSSSKPTYNVVAYNVAIEAWKAQEPNRYDGYFDYDGYEEAYNNWEKDAPLIATYNAKYESEGLARAAYEAAYDEWFAKKPSETDPKWYNDDAYQTAFEAWEGKKPSKEDYVIDSFDSQMDADAAYVSAWLDWTNNEPKETDFVTEEDFQAAYSEWVNDKPLVNDKDGKGNYIYDYKDESFKDKSEDEILAAWDEKIAEWEKEEPTGDEFTDLDQLQSDHKEWEEEKPKTSDFEEGGVGFDLE